jgi:hypothetical protein
VTIRGAGIYGGNVGSLGPLPDLSLLPEPQIVHTSESHCRECGCYPGDRQGCPCPYCPCGDMYDADWGWEE